MIKSGLQLKVLNLYREFLKAALKKPKDTQIRFISEIREGFERNRKVNPRDVNTIEYLIRRGRAQLNWLKNEDVTDIYKK